MKDISSGEIEYKGQTYRLVFNLNVLELIQETYGTVDKWAELTDGKDGEPNVKALIFGLTEMINEWIDMQNEEAKRPEEVRPMLTQKYVGRMLTELGMQQMSVMMKDTVVASTKGEEKNE